VPPRFPHPLQLPGQLLGRPAWETGAPVEELASRRRPLNRRSAPESPVTPVPPVRPLCRRFIGQVECLQGRGLYVPGDVAVPPPTGLGAPRVEYDASFAVATHEHLDGVRRQFRRRRYVEECLAGGREEHDLSFPITTHLIATFVHPR
jgi:hypothetical protein